MSSFFIDRPVFASVLSIVIVLAGLGALRFLPIAQYPELVPPQVVVTASYPGASAETVAENVAAPLEQQINGVEDMLYMQSTSAGSGTLNLTITFKTGTDPNQAVINVNNRIQQALPGLPEEVRREGIFVLKQSSSTLEILALSSPDRRYDAVFMSNYALINIVDELKRLPGVGNATLFAPSDYSMRIWLRPDKLAQYGLTPSDVVTAIRQQNAQFAAGRFGEEPMPGAQSFTYSATTEGRLDDPRKFEQIILRADSNGAGLRLKDVARVELGALSYATSSTLDGTPTVPIGIYLQPGANALAVARDVKATMDQLAHRFPSGLQYSIPFDTTGVIAVSIHAVIMTFAEAIVLVIAIVLLFLQNWRATLIPILAVPVSIIGTFAGMYVLGFSINLLTLFGLILAIGIVVDDAIIVLENVERIMATEGRTPREASIQAMREVSGPVIAVVLVLCAVFVPVSFLGGLVGEMYRQFAVTIAISVIISGIVALTLTPALCALLLKPGHGRPWLPFRIFNSGFERLTGGFTATAGFFLRHAALALVLVAAMLGATWWLFQAVPGALVPDEDQGYVLLVTALPPAAALDRTRAVTDRVSAGALKNPAVADVLTITGYDVLSGALKTNAAVSFVTLKDWSKRSDPALDARRLAPSFAKLNNDFRDGVVVAFNPPPIPGLSTTGGVEFFLQDRSGGSLAKLSDATERLVEAAKRRKELTGVSTTFTVEVPQYRLNVDREKAQAMGVPLNTIFETMQSTFGSLYVNDFGLFGRTFRVTLSSEAEFRRSPGDLRQVFVRSNDGAMIPLNALVSATRIVGPELVNRFNGFPAAQLQANPAPGYSSGQAIAAIREVAAQAVAADYTLAWTGSAYQELQNSGAASQGFVFGIIMVFLILAAQYERWSLPIAVLAAVPFAVFGAIAATWLRGLANDIYFQVGLITLIALAAKNAILIVEFAVHRWQQGLGARESALEAVRLRFRPIVMTSLAFVMGVLPLAISSGAGDASRHSVGTGVIGGMIAATFLAVLYVPLFFCLVTRRRRIARVMPDREAAELAETRPLS